MVRNLTELEKRLEQLEREVQEIRASRLPEQQDAWWETASKDVVRPEVYEEIVRLGAAFRRDQRET